jgi:polysaccharide biosynthesis transport protein
LQQTPDTLNLEQALDILRRRAGVIALCVLVFGGVAFGISRRETKKYTGTASASFDNGSLSQQIVGLPSSASSAGSLLAQRANQLELVRLGDMAEKTASQLGHGLTREKVSDSLTINQQGESGVVGVSATATSPRLAAAIANTYVQVFVGEQQSSSRAYLKSALALVNKQLRALKPAQRIGQDGLQLQNRAQTLRLLSELGYGEAKVAQEAFAPASPSSPNTSRNTMLGVVLGLLVGLGLAFLFEHFDRRIRRPADLEAIYDRPLLGLVPRSRALSRGRDHGGPLPSLEADAFRLISAQVRFLSTDCGLNTILVTSSDPGDGKTTIARHLAEAMARLRSRVLLLEGDLRNPTLSKQLGVSAELGLADVLGGAILMDEATQTIDLTGFRHNGNGALGSHARTLDVLLAGGAIPADDPAGLVESETVESVLEQAKAVYDLVVIDAPPLTPVSDGFPLLSKVDGIVVIGRLGHSRRDAAEQLHQVLEVSGASLLGVIANNAKSRGRVSAYSAGQKRDTAMQPSAGPASRQLQSLAKP